MDKLKRCPFCGGEAKLEKWYLFTASIEDGYIDRMKCRVRCQNCDCRTKYFYETDKTRTDERGNFLEFITFEDCEKDAIETWNTREEIPVDK